MSGFLENMAAWQTAVALRMDASCDWNSDDHAVEDLAKNVKHLKTILSP